MLYLLSEAPAEERNFAMVMELLRTEEVHEDDDQFQSVLDTLFDRLEHKCPDSLAVKQYKIYKMAAGDISCKGHITTVFGHTMDMSNTAESQEVCGIA